MTEPRFHLSTSDVAIQTLTEESERIKKSIESREEQPETESFSTKGKEHKDKHVSLHLSRHSEAFKEKQILNQNQVNLTRKVAKSNGHDGKDLIFHTKTVNGHQKKAPTQRKRQRMSWTPNLHSLFESAVIQAGGIEG